jgi:hypothetical protein
VSGAAASYGQRRGKKAVAQRGNTWCGGALTGGEVAPSDDGDLRVASDRCHSNRGATNEGAGRNGTFMARCGTVAARRRVARRMAPGGDGVSTCGPRHGKKEMTSGTSRQKNPELKTLPK